MSLGQGRVATYSLVNRYPSYAAVPGFPHRINPCCSEKRLALEVRKRSPLGMALCEAVLAGNELWWKHWTLSSAPQAAVELMIVVREEIDRERSYRERHELEAATTQVQQSATPRRL